MKLFLAIAAGALGYCYYRGSELKARKVGGKEEVRRWEGEGGNVPAVATPSPSPAPIPGSPNPPDNGVIRH